MKPWTEVTSSNLSALCVDEAGLRVRFTNGSEYLYADAGDDEFDAIVSASSPGRTFDRMVKRKFSGDKVETPAAPADAVMTMTIRADHPAAALVASTVILDLQYRAADGDVDEQLKAWQAFYDAAVALQSKESA